MYANAIRTWFKFIVELIYFIRINKPHKPISFTKFVDVSIHQSGSLTVAEMIVLSRLHFHLFSITQSNMRYVYSIDNVISVQNFHSTISIDLVYLKLMILVNCMLVLRPTHTYTLNGLQCENSIRTNLRKSVFKQIEFCNQKSHRCNTTDNLGI